MIRMTAGNSCPECGKGDLVYAAKPGRTFDYRGFSYEIPETMQLVQCTNCYDIPMTMEEIEAIEVPIAKHYQAIEANLVNRLRSLTDGVEFDINSHLPVED